MYTETWAELGATIAIAKSALDIQFSFILLSPCAEGRDFDDGDEPAIYKTVKKGRTVQVRP
jgi:hypothetical protein